MGRGRREKVSNNYFKYMLYLFLSVLGVMVITFIITIVIYINKLKKSGFSDLTAEKIAELIPDETNLTLEETSTSIGKSIEEAVKQIEESNNIEQEETEIKDEKVETKKQVKEETNEKEKTEEEEPVKDPVFTIPVEGEIIRGYAKDTLIYSETLQEWITHTGIDIKAPRTTVVKAAEKGKVFAIKNDPRYGLTVIIEHVNGFKTVYSNLLTTEFVSEGDNVEKGQSIGTVGNSASFEIIDEPHIHFEILKDDIQVDPNIYL